MASILPTRLEDLPNIGKSIADDLRALGINTPAQLRGKSPMMLYKKLERVTGHRHDPCILYTLLAAEDFLKSGKPTPWWKFTETGKKLLGRR